MLINVTRRRRSFCDQLRIYSLNITIMATVFLIFVFLGATTYLYMHSETTLNTQNAHSEYFEQKAIASGLFQINKKQGYPLAVVKGKEETPYFLDKQGRK